MKKLSIIIALLICGMTTAIAQQEWENVPLDSYRWQIASGLTARSTTATNLQVENLNAESEAKKASNQIDYLETTLMLNLRDNKPFSASFRIDNQNNNPAAYKYRVYGRNRRGELEEQWHKRNIYWGIFVVFYGMDGREVSNQVWFSARKGSYGNEYGISKNNSGWNQTVYSSAHTIYIEKSDNNALRMYMDYDSGENHIGSWSNIAGIKQITIMAGTASKVEATNLNLRRKTAYGLVKPIIARGDSFFERKLFVDAVREYTDAINKGYKNADIYVDRARANAMREYYVVAIEDCTTALTYDPTNKDAYFIRGLCKLQREDDSGVADLRNAGDEGEAILKEYGLYDYYPNQNNSTIPNPQIQQQQRVPIPQNRLRKDPNFKIE